MNKILLLLCLALTTNCAWINYIFKTKSEKMKIVETAVEHYNAYNEQAYNNMFDENVNYFVSNGLGTTRFASGKEDLKRFNTHVFTIKKNRTEVLEMFETGEWVFVRQRTYTIGGDVEAAIGYRIPKDKITDMMVVGENRIDKPKK